MILKIRLWPLFLMSVLLPAVAAAVDVRQPPAGTVPANVGLLWNWHFMVVIVAAVLIASLAARLLTMNRLLLQQQKHFQTLFDHNGSGHLIVSSTRQILEVNKQFCALFGYDRNELIGQSASVLHLDCEHYESWAPRFQEARGGITMGSEDYPWRRKDGTVFWCSFTGVRLSLPDGAPGVIWSVIDITKRKRMEEELLQNRSMLRHILDSIPQSIFWKDPTSTYLGCNKVFAQSIGLNDTEEIVGKTDFNLPWPREEAESHRAADQEVLQAKRPKWHIQERLQRADGTRLWCDATKVPLIDQAGAVYGILGVHEDITDRKRAEEELKEAELKIIRQNRLYAVLSKTNGAIIRSNEPEVLFEQACKIAVEDGLFRMAWIGVLDPATLLIKPVAQYGHDDGYLDSVQVSIDPAVPNGRGPTGTALCEKRGFVNNDTENNPLVDPWRDEALKRGFLSSAVLPLVSNGRLYGTITFYASTAHYFNAEVIHLLSTLQDDLSFALEFMLSQEKRKQAEDALRESEKFLSTIIETEPECVKLLAADGSILMMNRAGLDMIQADSFDQVKGKSASLLIDREYADAFRKLIIDVFQGKPGSLVFKMCGMKGRPLWLDIHAVPLRNDKGDIVSLLGITSNITERKRQEEQLLYLANYDILTGLPNRNLLTDRFQQAAAIETRHHTFLAVMLMDLDNFKFVNDTMGHAVGDVLLKEVASRIQAAVRTSDTVARLGGDEFVLVPVNISSSQDVAKVAEQIISALSTPFSINGREIFLTVSIGIANYPQDGDSLDVLLKHADIAMYHAKHLGKNNYQFFTEEINKRIHDRLSTETLLRKALERKEFLLHYQPVIELKTGRVVGMEALLRWQPEGEKLIPPNNFILLLEETGLIIPVGEWVLRTACRQLNTWRQDGHDLHLSVNISARQFHTANIAEHISEIVQHCGCTPRQICLELTESIIMNDSEETIQKLDLLRSMGFSLAIDDFGTGFSSLNYLKRLPMSELKIDRTFIASLPANSKDAAIVNTIIQMANHLKMKVVAEGVETEEQLHFLSDNGCHEVQGYYFSKPLPPDEFDVSQLRLNKLAV